MAAVGDKVEQPGHLVWVAVGDRAKIEPGIRAPGWGEIQFLDADGNPLATAETEKQQH